MNAFQDSYTLILEEIRSVLDRVDYQEVRRLTKAILSAEQIFLIGVGRVMLVLKAFCKRLNHLGIRAHCVGDVNEPAINDKDLLIVGSGSGETVIPVAIARVAGKYKPQLAHLGSNPHSSLEPMSDIFVRIPTVTRLNLYGELPSKQPMTNLFEQSLYILCDAVTFLIIKEKGLDQNRLWECHANLE